MNDFFLMRLLSRKTTIFIATFLEIPASVAKLFKNLKNKLGYFLEPEGLSLELFLAQIESDLAEMEGSWPISFFFLMRFHLVFSLVYESPLTAHFPRNNLNILDNGSAISMEVLE